MNGKAKTGLNRIMKNKAQSQVLLLGIALTVIIIIMCIATDRFYQTKNIMNILTQITALGIAAVGVGTVMISGGIDLTLGNIMSLAGCTTAAMMQAELPTGAAIVAGIAVATLCGTLNGVLIMFSKAEPFIITLGMMSVYKGITLCITKGNNLTAASNFTFGREKIFGVIPIPILCLLAVYIIMFLMLKYTKFGRKAYAVGNNPDAAYLVGIRIKTTKILIYTLNGLLLGIASMILLSRLGSGNSVMGDSLLMEAIAAAVIGGVSLAGGKGTVPGIFLGTILIGVISNALNLLRVQSFYQYIVIGAVIVGAVSISNVGTRQR